MGGDTRQQRLVVVYTKGDQLDPLLASYPLVREHLNSSELLELKRCALFMLDEERMELVPYQPAFGLSLDETDKVHISLADGELSQRFWQSRARP